MGHETIEMIMRHYGKWVPDGNLKAGYQSVIDWDNVWGSNCTHTARKDY